MSRARSGAATRDLLALLIALAGAAGGFNYYRNHAADHALERPYQAYTEADLEALHDAYAQELSTGRDRHRAVLERRDEARDRGHISDQIRELERVQQGVAARRSVLRELGSVEATREELAREMDLRRAEHDRFATFLRRLLSV